MHGTRRPSQQAGSVCVRPSVLLLVHFDVDEEGLRVSNASMSVLPSRDCTNPTNLYLLFTNHGGEKDTTEASSVVAPRRSNVCHDCVGIDRRRTWHLKKIKYILPYICLHYFTFFQFTFKHLYFYSVYRLCISTGLLKQDLTQAL